MSPAAVQRFSASTMEEFLRAPMEERPLWGPRLGPPTGWAAMLETPSILRQPPNGLARETLAAVAPLWLARPDIFRRIVIESESSQASSTAAAAAFGRSGQVDGLVEVDDDDTTGTSALWLRVETRAVDMSTDWTPALRLSFGAGEFNLRPCGGGRGEMLVLRGVHNSSAAASPSGERSPRCGRREKRTHNLCEWCRTVLEPRG